MGIIFQDQMAADYPTGMQMNMHGNLTPLINHYLREDIRGRSPGSAHQKTASEIITRKFWLTGEHERSLSDLEIIATQSINPVERQAALIEMAKLHLLDIQSKPRDAAKATTWAKRAYNEASSREARNHASIVLAVCCYYSKNHNEARTLLRKFISSGDYDPDVLLALAFLRTSDQGKIAWINNVLTHFGIAQLSLASADASIPLLDRLTSEARNFGPKLGPKVSVIIAAYNASSTLYTALRSLQKQTWQNIEVIVVDDCSSTLETQQIVDAFRSTDPRFYFKRLSKNGGAYVARNYGLDLCTGDFVTVHDADDWSHPIKIETQVQFLLENSTAVIGCTSEQARCTPSLDFSEIRSNGRFIFFNTSSFMWRHKLVRETLGYWDNVRFGADSEFVARVKRQFGPDSVVRMATGPLSFQRQSESSVTQDRIRGLQSLNNGVRMEYREAQEFFHSSGHSIKYIGDPSFRPFPVRPLMLRSQKSGQAIDWYDIVIFGNAYEGSAQAPEILNLALQYRRQDRTVAIVPSLNYCESLSSARVEKELRRLINQGEIHRLVVGEEVKCDYRIIVPPAPTNSQFLANVKYKFTTVANAQEW